MQGVNATIPPAISTSLRRRSGGIPQPLVVMTPRACSACPRPPRRWPGYSGDSA